MSWFKAAFGYALGRAAGKAIFGDGERPASAPSGPVRSMTEAEIQADEERFREDERRLEELDKQEAKKPPG